LSITIYKYDLDNYFDADGSELIDKIEIDEVLEVPEILEEYTKEDEIDVIKSGSYDVKFSLLQTDTSTNGDTIREFLLPINVSGGSNNREYLYLCSLHLGTEYYDGIIDRASIVADLNPTSNGWDIGFTTIGMLKSVVEHLETINVSFLGYYGGESFLTFMGRGKLFGDLSALINIDNDLSLDDKCGFAVYANYYTFYALYINGLNRGYTVWAGLKSIMQALGFVIKVTRFGITATNFPVYNLQLLWRSTGANTVSPQFIKHEESLTLDFVKKNLFIKTAQHISTTYYGIFLYSRLPNGYADIANVLGDGAFAEQGNNLVFFIGTTLYEIPLAKIEYLDLDFHAFGSTYDPKTMAFANVLSKTITLFDRSYLGDIMVKTALPEYQYLMSGVKRIKEFTIRYNSDEGIRLFDKFTVENITYYIIKLKINLANRTAKVRAIEV